MSTHTVVSFFMNPKPMYYTREACCAMYGPITVASQFKAWTVFARSNTGIVDSNPTQGMGVCVRLFCACLFCV
jgi:hypothetical protein